jgi:hypothetical protein
MTNTKMFGEFIDPQSLPTGRTLIAHLSDLTSNLSQAAVSMKKKKKASAGIQA